MSGSSAPPHRSGARKPPLPFLLKLPKRPFFCWIFPRIRSANKLSPDNHMLTIADVLEALTSFRPPNAEIVITEGAIDSRQVIPACLFIAIPGERVDGHDYISEAFRKGAS